jgi:hypothetical protein
MLTNLIIGFLGEVGSALRDVLGDNHRLDNLGGIDLGNNSFGLSKDRFDILHICIPYSDQFVEQVKRYQKNFKPTYTIIHSTVPVGTSKKLSALHSPVRGLHPHLVEGMRTFPKFIGGPGASGVADVFRKAGIKVILVDKAETTELGKLFDTEYYRVCIEFMQSVKERCDKEGLNFHEVYTLFNQTYNEGYTKLGFSEYVRPVLQPIMTPIGGHCVLPNAELINE